MKWFKHDSSAHTDPKLQKVLMKYGTDGYAIYWYCLELIAGKVDMTHITFELEHDAEVIGFTLKVDQLRVEEIMKFMCELSLFERNNGVISCQKMARRLDDTNSRHPSIRALLEKIQRKPQDPEASSENPEASSENPEASSENPEASRRPSDQTRLDKIRLDKNKVNKEKKVGFQPPSALEVQEYLDGKNITEFTGQEFTDYYATTGWKRGKNKIVSWQHCVGTWKNNNPEKTLEVII